jgi:DNA-binding LacI/PurR family transcriptional regulator
MRGATFTIGFEIPHLGNEFLTQVMEGATTGLAASRYQLIVAPGLGYLSGTSVLDALVDRQVDGIIAISSKVTVDWLEQLAKHVPVVVLGRHDRSAEYDSVTDDDVAGVDLVMSHLLGLGHQRIAHLTLRPPTDLAPHAIRLAAYRSRMEQAGREPQVVYSQTSEQEAYEAARTLLKGSNPPTAIFAGHDTLAIGVLGEHGAVMVIQRGQDRPGRISGPLGDRGQAAGTGRHRRGADGQHAGQGVSSAPPVTGVGDHRQPLQQARAVAQGKRAGMVGVGDGGGDGG